METVVHVRSTGSPWFLGQKLLRVAPDGDLQELNKVNLVTNENPESQWAHC